MYASKARETDRFTFDPNLEDLRLVIHTRDSCGNGRQLSLMIHRLRILLTTWLLLCTSVLGRAAPADVRAEQSETRSRFMRRAPTQLAVFIATIALAGLAFAGQAPATPTVRLKALPVPIPGFPHTGDILGAGTAARAEYTIEGNEYSVRHHHSSASTSTCRSVRRCTHRAFPPVLCPRSNNSARSAARTDQPRDQWAK